MATAAGCGATSSTSWVTSPSSTASSCTAPRSGCGHASRPKPSVHTPESPCSAGNFDFDSRRGRSRRPQESERTAPSPPARNRHDPPQGAARRPNTVRFPDGRATLDRGRNETGVERVGVRSARAWFQSSGSGADHVSGCRRCRRPRPRRHRRPARRVWRGCAGRCARGVGQADAVVGDIEGQGVVDRDGDHDSARVGMVDDVTERLAQHRRSVLGQQSGDDVDRPRHPHGGAQSCVGGLLGDDRVEDLPQSGAAPVQTVDPPLSLLGAVVAHRAAVLDNKTEQPCLGRSSFGETASSPAGCHRAHAVDQREHRLDPRQTSTPGMRHRPGTTPMVPSRTPPHRTTRSTFVVPQSLRRSVSGRVGARFRMQSDPDARADLYGGEP